jgi:hypothetical protein
MAEIGKVTPGNPIITRVPRDRPASDEKEHQPEPKDDENGEENEENNERDNEENNKRDEDGGIDFYV